MGAVTSQITLGSAFSVAKMSGHSIEITVVIPPLRTKNVVFFVGSTDINFTICAEEKSISATGMREETGQWGAASTRCDTSRPLL